MQQKNCSFCGAAFSCGADSGQTCWCASLPNVMPYPSKSDCLCPACLKAQVEKVLAYDAVSAAYAQKYGDEIMLKPVVQRFIADFIATVPEDETICDMGCGPGQVARYVKQTFNRPVTGVDLSSQMIERAKALNPDIPFTCADVMQLDETCGAIMAFYFIVNFQPGHLPILFNKLNSLLKVGGKLLLSFHLGNDELLRVEDLWESGKPLDFYLFKPETVSKTLSDAGFKVNDIRFRHPDKAIEYESERAYIFAEK